MEVNLIAQSQAVRLEIPTLISIVIAIGTIIITTINLYLMSKFNMLTKSTDELREKDEVIFNTIEMVRKEADSKKDNLYINIDNVKMDLANVKSNYLIRFTSVEQKIHNTENKIIDKIDLNYKELNSCIREMSEEFSKKVEVMSKEFITKDSCNRLH